MKIEDSNDPDLQISEINKPSEATDEKDAGRILSSKSFEA